MSNNGNQVYPSTDNTKTVIHIHVAILAKNIKNEEQFKKTADGIKPTSWTPWICDKNDNPDEIGRIALHRSLRESGYLNLGCLSEVSPLSVQVSYFTEDTPRYPSGSPKMCNTTVYALYSDNN